MTNIERVNRFLDDAKTFYFLTTDGDKPKGRPFGFHLLDGDKLYFGCGTFKNVFSQLTKNPNVEVLAVRENEFMRYDGTVKIVKDTALLDKVRATLPQIIFGYLISQRNSLVIAPISFSTSCVSFPPILKVF